MINLKIISNNRKYKVRKLKYISLIFYLLFFIYFFSFTSFHSFFFIYFSSFTSLYLFFLMHLFFTHLSFTFLLFISSNTIFDSVTFLHFLCEASFLFHLHLTFITDQAAASFNYKNADRYCRNCKFMI